jgi:hypothetical protein
LTDRSRDLFFFFPRLFFVRRPLGRSWSEFDDSDSSVLVEESLRFTAAADSLVLLRGFRGELGLGLERVEFVESGESRIPTGTSKFNLWGRFLVSFFMRRISASSCLALAFVLSSSFLWRVARSSQRLTSSSCLSPRSFPSSRRCFFLSPLRSSKCTDLASCLVSSPRCFSSFAQAFQMLSFIPPTLLQLRLFADG